MIKENWATYNILDFFKEYVNNTNHSCDTVTMQQWPYDSFVLYRSEKS